MPVLVVVPVLVVTIPWSVFLQDSRLVMINNAAMGSGKLFIIQGFILQYVKDKKNATGDMHYIRCSFGF